MGTLAKITEAISNDPTLAPEAVRALVQIMTAAILAAIANRQETETKKGTL